MQYQLVIDGDIGYPRLGTDNQSIRHALEGLADRHVDVKISSLGGSLFDGFDIRQQFIDHGDVTAYLCGFVASAATVAAMGAQRVVMGKYALFLVHQCANVVEVSGLMNAADLEEAIARLEQNKDENEKIDNILAAMYSLRCKNHTQTELLELLKQSRWLSAQEALDWGFVDEILDDDEEPPVMTDALAKRFNAAGLPACPGLVAQDDRNTRLRRLLESLKSFFNEIKNVDDTHRTNIVTMINKYPTLASLLNKQAIAMTDGSSTLTADQLQVVEDRLNALSSQSAADAATIDELHNRTAELEQQVKNLQQAPADVTATVDEASADNRKLNSIEMYNTIKDLI